MLGPRQDLRQAPQVHKEVYADALDALVEPEELTVPEAGATHTLDRARMADGQTRCVTRSGAYWRVLRVLRTNRTQPRILLRHPPQAGPTATTFTGPGLVVAALVTVGKCAMGKGAEGAYGATALGSGGAETQDRTMWATSRTTIPRDVLWRKAKSLEDEGSRRQNKIFLHIFFDANLSF